MHWRDVVVGVFMVKYLLGTPSVHCTRRPTTIDDDVYSLLSESTEYYGGSIDITDASFWLLNLPLLLLLVPTRAGNGNRQSIHSIE